jgi:hypothetical protein
MALAVTGPFDLSAMGPPVIFSGGFPSTILNLQFPIKTFEFVEFKLYRVESERMRLLRSLFTGKPCKVTKFRPRFVGPAI